jgi:hypothetical protein
MGESASRPPPTPWKLNAIPAGSLDERTRYARGGRNSDRNDTSRCVEAYYAYYVQRTRFESLAGRKLRRRQLTEDGNVEITGGTCATRRKSRGRQVLP